jgi:hypothetical protein
VLNDSRLSRDALRDVSVEIRLGNGSSGGYRGIFSRVTL